MGGNLAHQSLLLGGNSARQSILDWEYGRYLDKELDNSKRPRFSPLGVIGDTLELNLSILDRGSRSGDEEEEENSKELLPQVKASKKKKFSPA